MAARRRVVLVTHRWHPNHPTGVARSVDALVTALAGLPSAPEYELSAGLEPGQPERGPGGFAIVPAGRRRRMRYLRWAVTGRPPIERWIGPAGLVHVLTPFAPVPSRAPVIYTIHDINPILSPGEFSRVDTWAFRRAVGDAVERAVAIAVPSQFVADALNAHMDVPTSRVEVIPWGAGLALDSAGSHAAVASTVARHGLKPKTYFVAIGTMSRRKNIEVLVRALSQRDGARLALIGPSGHRGDHIDQLMTALDVRDRITRVPFVSDAELTALVSQSIALLHPCPTEGFGFPPLEAMTAGVPVAAANAGSLPEIVGDAALLVDPFDVDAWADAMEALAGDDGLGVRLAGAGRARAREFSWAETARRTALLHERLLSAG